MSINPAFGLFLSERLKQARTEAGGSLNWTVVAAICQLAYEEEVKQFNAGSPPPEKKPRRKTPLNQMTDEEFLAELESLPVYEGIDIKRELGKAQTWYKLRGKVATRMCVINWLNKADRTVGYNGVGKTSAVPDANIRSPYVEPANWQQMATRAFPHLDFTEKRWEDISILVRKDILSKTAP